MIRRRREGEVTTPGWSWQWFRGLWLRHMQYLPGGACIKRTRALWLPFGRRLPRLTWRTDRYDPAAFGRLVSL